MAGCNENSIAQSYIQQYYDVVTEYAGLVEAINKLQPANEECCEQKNETLERIIQKLDKLIALNNVTCLVHTYLKRIIVDILTRKVACICGEVTTSTTTEEQETTTTTSTTEEIVDTTTTTSGVEVTTTTSEITETTTTTSPVETSTTTSGVETTTTTGEIVETTTTTSGVETTTTTGEIVSTTTTSQIVSTTTTTGTVVSTTTTSVLVTTTTTTLEIEYVILKLDCVSTTTTTVFVPTTTTTTTVFVSTTTTTLPVHGTTTTTFEIVETTTTTGYGGPSYSIIYVACLEEETTTTTTVEITTTTTTICVRPEEPQQDAFIYAWNITEVGWDTFLYGTPFEACVSFHDFKNTEFTDGDIAYYPGEYLSFEKGQTVYEGYDLTNCEVIPPGVYWVETTLPKEPEASEVYDLTCIYIVTVNSEGVITYIDECCVYVVSTTTTADCSLDGNVICYEPGTTTTLEPTTTTTTTSDCSLDGSVVCYEPDTTTTTEEPPTTTTTTADCSLDGSVICYEATTTTSTTEEPPTTTTTTLFEGSTTTTTFCEECTTTTTIEQTTTTTEEPTTTTTTTADCSLDGSVVCYEATTTTTTNPCYIEGEIVCYEPTTTTTTLDCNLDGSVICYPPVTTTTTTESPCKLEGDVVCYPPATTTTTTTLFEGSTTTTTFCEECTTTTTTINCSLDGSVICYPPPTTTTTTTNNIPVAYNSEISITRSYCYYPESIVASLFLYSDPDGDPINLIRITSLPTIGVLTYNGLPVYINQLIPVIQPGTYFNHPLLYWCDEFTYSGHDDVFTFQIRTDNNPIFSNIATFTIHVSSCPGTTTTTTTVCDLIVIIVEPTTTTTTIAPTTTTSTTIDCSLEGSVICYETTTTSTTTLEVTTTTTTCYTGCVTLGYLYNWYAQDNVKKLSSSDDWEPSYLNSYFTAEECKETGTTYWNSPNVATNAKGLNLRGCGYRSGTSGAFSGINVYWFERINPTLDHYFALNSSGSFSAASGDNRYRLGFSQRFMNQNTLLQPGECGTYTGNDGKIYPTICIDCGVNGYIEFMTCDLAETEYRDHTEIPYISDNGTWAALSTGARCAYNNDPDNVGIDECWDGIPTTTTTTTVDCSLSGSVECYEPTTTTTTEYEGTTTTSTTCEECTTTTTTIDCSLDGTVICYDATTTTTTEPPTTTTTTLEETTTTTTTIDCSLDGSVVCYEPPTTSTTTSTTSTTSTTMEPCGVCTPDFHFDYNHSSGLIPVRGDSYYDYVLEPVKEKGVNFYSCPNIPYNNSWISGNIYYEIHIYATTTDEWQYSIQIARYTAGLTLIEIGGSKDDFSVYGSGYIVLSGYIDCTWTGGSLTDRIGVRVGFGTYYTPATFRFYTGDTYDSYIYANICAGATTTTTTIEETTTTTSTTEEIPLYPNPSVCVKLSTTIAGVICYNPIEWVYVQYLTVIEPGEGVYSNAACTELISSDYKFIAVEDGTVYNISGGIVGSPLESTCTGWVCSTTTSTSTSTSTSTTTEEISTPPIYRCVEKLISSKKKLSIDYTEPWGVYVTPTGTKMYVSFIDFSEGSNKQPIIAEYNLTSPFETAQLTYVRKKLLFKDYFTYRSLFLKQDGDRAYIINQTLGRIECYNLTVQWDITSAGSMSYGFDLGTISGMGLYFSPDGTKMFVTGKLITDATTSYIFKYDLNVAWDLSAGATLSQTRPVSNNNISGIWISNDGMTIYYIIYWIGSWIAEDNTWAIKFDEGSLLIVDFASGNPNGSVILSCRLNNAWDLSTLELRCSFWKNNFNSDIFGSPTSLRFYCIDPNKVVNNVPDIYETNFSLRLFELDYNNLPPYWSWL